MILRDSNENIRRLGSGDTFIVQANDKVVSFTDNKDGSYSGSYTINNVVPLLLSVTFNIAGASTPKTTAFKIIVSASTYSPSDSTGELWVF
jgi:hypothetical protein